MFRDKRGSIFVIPKRQGGHNTNRILETIEALRCSHERGFARNTYATDKETFFLAFSWFVRSLYFVISRPTSSESRNCKFGCVIRKPN